MIAVWALLVGCSNFDGALAAYERGDLSNDFPEGTLRVDVYPTADGNNLLPQSFLASPDSYADEVEIPHALEATVEFSGLLSAEVVQGWAPSASAEGNALFATVRADRSGLVQSGATHTDETGAFSLTLPGGQPYSVSLIPDVATASPLTFLGNLDMAAGRDIRETVSPAAPVYGRITANGSEPLASAPLVIRDVESGFASPTFYTDATGWFVVRAQVGRSYTIESVGSDLAQGPVIPSVSIEFSVNDDEGVQVDLELGALETVNLSANIVDDSGAGLGGATVRLTSIALYGSEGSLTLETTNQGNGGFGIAALPGKYRAEIWPDADHRDLAPVLYGSLDLSTDVDLGEIALTLAKRVKGRVENDDATLVANAVVTATQVYGGQYSYSTTTDESGEYRLQLPIGDYSLRITPASANDGALVVEDLDVNDDQNVVTYLPTGTTVNGNVSYQGSAVAFALVEIVDPNTGALLAQAVTNAEGGYSARVALDYRSLDGGGDSGEADTGEADTGEADTGEADTGTEDSGGDTGL